MSNISHIIHKNSSEKNSENNGPKIPDANDIEYGEIAINYDKGNETLFIKNNEDDIIEFVNKDNIINVLPYKIKLILLKLFSLLKEKEQFDKYSFAKNYNNLIDEFNLIEKDKKLFRLNYKGDNVTSYNPEHPIVYDPLNHINKPTTTL